MIKIEFYTKKRKAAIMKAALDASCEMLDDLKSQQGLHPFASVAMIAGSAANLASTLSALKTKPLFLIKAGQFRLEYRKPFKFSFHRIKKPLQLITVNVHNPLGSEDWDKIVEKGIEPAINRNITLNKTIH